MGRRRDGASGGKPWATLLCLAACLHIAAAHVQLQYPPGISVLDFLDNLRTKNICGDEASGADNSGYWRLPEVNNNTVTTLKAGDTLNATWNLHYAHQGGWNFELFDAEATKIAVWNDSSHYDCNHDGTQQWVELTLPNITCTNCTLRLVRQALEWGESYLFHSCALVNIEKSDDVNATCNGCSGHGTCIKGACECDNDPVKGFWEGTYCDRQNECDEDEHCGEGGMCIDVGATSPPKKQCYCKEGWFGDEVTPWAPDSILPTRTCDRQSNLTLGNPDEWEDEYPNKQTSVPSGAFTVFYKIDEEAEEIEFAIRATTDNWVAVGLRAASTRGVPPPRSGPTGAPATSEGAPASEGEPTAEAEGEGEGYEMEKEKEEGYETEAEGEPASEGTPAASEGAPVASEGAPASEGEGASSEGSGSGGICPAGNATVSTEDSFVLLVPEDQEANKTGNGTGNGRRLFAMPRLEAEAEESLVLPRRMSPGRHLVESEGASEGAPEGASEGEQFPSNPSKPILTFFGPPGCRNPLVDNPNAHPMINQDIVVGYARGEAFRVQDSFTPSRARPLPDVYFGGQDDILDAVGREEDGTTFLKYRRPLQTADTDGDFCIVEDTIYLVIYAYGQPAGDYTHIPDSSLETGHATNLEFYGRDELKFHGGGIGASYEGRGSFGQVDFFAAPAAAGGACSPSSLEGYDCAQEVIPGQYVLNWRVEEDGVALAAEATGAGYVALAWPSQAGQMVGAEAVIGWAGDDGPEVGMFDLNAKSVEGVVATDGTFEISDESVEETDGKTVLKFTRKFDADFALEGSHDLLAAFHTDSDDLAYHSARQGFAVSLAGGEAAEGAEGAGEAEEAAAVEGQTARGAVANAGGEDSSVVDSTLRSSEGAGCLISSLEDYDCMVLALEPAFYVHWAVDGETLRLAGEAQAAGFVSIGFASTPGQMVGSRAVIGWAGAEDSVAVYDLTSQAVDGILPSTALEIFDESIEEVDGKTILRFSTAFDEQLLPDAENAMVVAFHPENDGLAYHGGASRGAASLNFATGTSAVTAVEDLSNYWEAHGILMTVGWGILVPMGIIVARTMKHTAPVWFYIHVVGNTLGLALATVGFVMALTKFERDYSFRHKQVGIAAMALGFLQPLNGLVRPHPGQSWREVWEYVHWTVGRVAVGLAIWNIFTGLDEYEFLAEVGSKKYHVIYGLVLACLFAVYLAAEDRALRIAKRKGHDELSQRVSLLEKATATSAGIQMEIEK